MTIALDYKPVPTSHALSEENLDRIIDYFKKQQNVQDLHSLISSLESTENEGVSRANTLRANTSRVFQFIPGASPKEGDGDKRTGVVHTSRVFQGGASKWEGGEHEDDEVNVPLPDLKETARREQREAEKQEQIREAERRYRAEREIRSAGIKAVDTLINIGTFGLAGVLGLTLERTHVHVHPPIGIAVSASPSSTRLQDNRKYGLQDVPGVSYFESGEHDDKEVTVPGKTAERNLLTLPNGIQLTFGEIIAFAGDFYGIPEMPICEDVTGTSCESRFMAAFGTLGRGDVSAINKELSQIREILKIEKNSVATVLGRGDPSIPTVLEKDKTYSQPSDVYKYHGLWFTIQYDTILGGWWVKGVPVKFGRMMKLAENNPDHFQPYSRKVWEVGHEIALDKAREAREMFKARRAREEAVKLLNEAYAISAFSCHFLTDSFAAGHIRVPRVELPAVVTPAKAGNLLVHFQHDEDGQFGINVVNQDRERWRCFGDGTLYDEKSRENKKLVREVVQECVNQVWQEFRGEPHRGAEYVLRKIPTVDMTRPNNYPLFTAVSDKGETKVVRRYDVNDLSDSRRKNNWWGWSTVLKLKTYDPKNSVVDCG